MSYAVSVSLVLGTWSVLYLVNTFLLTYQRTSLQYAKLLHQCGISIGFMQIKWYTVKLNRIILRIANWKPLFWKAWFNIGVFVGLIGQFVSIGLLLYTLADYFRAKPIGEQILVPVLPGVNLPNNQIIYYFLTLFICGIVHEMGHAIAASREQVRVNGFGIFLMLIFPGAFVDLYTEHVEFISPIKQLRIFCAGVWHNFVFCILAIVILELHPYFVNIFFTQNAYISDININSPLRSILQDGTAIQRIHDCPVNSTYEWYRCLNVLEASPVSGYCMTENDINHMATNHLQTDKILNDCCYNNTASNYCFKWNSTSDLKQTYSCLPARYTTQKEICNTNKGCSEGGLNSICVLPLLDNVTKLVKIYHDKGQPVLYVGTADELRYSVYFKDFMPKYAFIPEFLNLQLQLLLKYLIAFNSAIGLLNLVPCYALDGQHILSALLLSKNTKSFRTMHVNNYPKTYSYLLTFGTVLLLLNLVFSMFSLFL